jgi:hypothetical protein
MNDSPTPRALFKRAMRKLKRVYNLRSLKGNSKLQAESLVLLWADYCDPGFSLFPIVNREVFLTAAQLAMRPESIKHVRIGSPGGTPLIELWRHRNYRKSGGLAGRIWADDSDVAFIVRAGVRTVVKHWRQLAGCPLSDDTNELALRSGNSLLPKTEQHPGESLSHRARRECELVFAQKDATGPGRYHARAAFWLLQQKLDEKNPRFREISWHEVSRAVAYLLQQLSLGSVSLKQDGSLEFRDTEGDLSAHVKAEHLELEVRIKTAERLQRGLMHSEFFLGSNTIRLS